LQGFLFSFASPFAPPGGAFVVRRDNDQGHASACKHGFADGHTIVRDGNPSWRYMRGACEPGTGDCSWSDDGEDEDVRQDGERRTVTDQLIGKLTEKTEAPWAGIRRGRGTDHETTSPVIDEGRREYLRVA
jgi:hypothetical protein